MKNKILTFIMAITVFFTTFVGTNIATSAGKIQILDPEHTTTSYWAYYEVASNGEYVVNIGFDYNTDKTGIVIKQCGGFGSMRSGGWCTVPRKINGLPVTEIASNAFADKSTSSTYWVKKLILPDTIKKIGANAFDGYSALEVIGFCGTDAEWNNISKNSSNAKLNEVEMKFGETDSYLSYLIEDGEAMVVDCNAITSTTISIPQYVGDALVTKINPNAFFISDIGTVEIPASVTEICDYAFWDAQIDKFEFSSASRLTKIGKNAFLRNTSLTEISIPDNVTEIGNSAFNGCRSLTKAELPENLTTVEPSLFAGCTSLTSITIPEKVTSIGIQAFTSCDSLKEVTIPKSVNYIDSRAFYDYSGTKSLKDVYYGGTEEDWNNITILSDGNEQLLNATIHFAEKGGSCGENLIWRLDEDGTLTISGSGEMNDYFGGLDIYAPWYSEKDNITKLVIDEGVTKIGDFSFYDLSNLKEAILCDSLTAIDKSAFSQCINLETINLPEKLQSLGMGAFANCQSLTKITIPGSVETIGNYAFDCCIGLKNVTLENGITSIGNSAFNTCSIKEIIIPESVTHIGSVSFAKCSYLENVEILGNIETIKSHTFTNSYLKSITLPKSINTIEANAFSDCRNLTDVYFGGTEDEWNAISIDASGNDTLLNATIHFEEDEISDDDRERFLETLNFYCDQLTSYETVKELMETKGEEYGFNMEKYFLLDSKQETIINKFINEAPFDSLDMAVEEFNNLIDRYALPGGNTGGGGGGGGGGEVTASGTCGENLEWYLAGDTLRIAGNGDMYDYDEESIPWRDYRDSITNVNIAPEVTSIGKNAFRGLSHITNIVIPDSITSIGEEAFYGCVELKDITLGRGVTFIDRGVFYDCNATENLYISDLEAYINIERVDIDSGQIAPNLYLNNELVTNLIIPEGISELGIFVFSDFKSIVTVTLHGGITEICEDAFSGCENIREVYYGGTRKSWSTITFGAGNDDLTNYVIFDIESEKSEFLFLVYGCYDYSGLDWVISDYRDILGLKLAAYDALDALQREQVLESLYGKNYETVDAFMTALNTEIETVTKNESEPEVSLNVQLVNDIYLVVPKNLQNGNCIVFACYKDDTLVYSDIFPYNGEIAVPFITDKDFDTAKIMAWEDLISCTPLCDSQEF